MFKVDDAPSLKNETGDIIMKTLDLARSLLEAGSAAFFLECDDFETDQKVYRTNQTDLISMNDDWKNEESLRVFDSVVVSPVKCLMGFRCGTMVLNSPDKNFWHETKTTQLESICQLLGQSLNGDLSRKMIYMNSRLATLGQMTAEIMHEINNPISFIRSGLSLMLIRANAGPLTDDFMKNMLQRMIFSTERMYQIISGIKSFSRNSDSDPLEVVNLSDLIRQSAAFCSERFKSTSVQFIHEPIQPDFNVKCRKVQISQVIINLINNAIDAVEGSNDPWVKIRVQDRGHQIGIQVEDSGNGVSEKNQRKLFQPFFTTKNGRGGTGLGLSISKNIVESNGGSLAYELSESGHTSFLIRLNAS